jgi:NADP-dependent aldehyde dehydrogenase
MQIPLGPVVVFGASNFPYAYSTAGGDTASALATGCPVIVKQHPAHPETSRRVFEIMLQAAVESGMPANVIQHVEDQGFETGKALVLHPATAAVGFTGSYNGGMALLEYARQRKNPIPVFGEMGSTNPVFILPGALQTKAEEIAQKLAPSITASMGQFCTNPGLLLGLKSEYLDEFVGTLAAALQTFEPSPMLHAGIEKAYIQKTNEALKQKGVKLFTTTASGNEMEQARALVATIHATDFLDNPLVHEEIFGPWSLLVVCENAGELLACRNAVQGQLTTSLWGTDEDFANFPELIPAALYGAGRIVFNGVPTGVEVCEAMVHGGPHPATTDSRFTAVGPMAIRRWTRPVSWQNAPAHLLPPALQEDNPLKLLRLVDGEWIK